MMQFVVDLPKAPLYYSLLLFLHYDISRTGHILYSAMPFLHSTFQERHPYSLEYKHKRYISPTILFLDINNNIIPKNKG